MKLISLKKHLNTEYCIHCAEDYDKRTFEHNGRMKLMVGGPYCEDLITLFTDTLEFEFALDTFNEGEKYILKDPNCELARIYLSIKDMVESGIIGDYIDGDEEGKVPVYYEKDGRIIRDFCVTPGYPNVTNSGTKMYDNTHFSDPLECAKYYYGSETDRKNVFRRHKEHIEEAYNRLYYCVGDEKRDRKRYQRLKEYIEGYEK